MRVHIDTDTNSAILIPDKPESTFKFKINDWVWQYTRNDEYERAQIKACKVINGHNCYTTDLVDQWTNETLLL